MKIFRKIQEVREWQRALQQQSKTVALVPTMGNLHQGHLELCSTAKKHADCVIASIFVNPMQFGANEDFSRYPRTEQADIEKLISMDITAVFIPELSEIYPSNFASSTAITVANLSDELCGKSRPGHFTGVATVVAKLCNIVHPDSIILGEKDYQQLLVIRQMIQDLNLAITVMSVPIIREQDGLAMSSRNNYLNSEERALAPQLYKTLNNIKTEINHGNHNLNLLSQTASTELEGKGFKIDYLEIRNSKNLTRLNENHAEQLIILVAAFLGKTRLIDNIIV